MDSADVRRALLGAHARSESLAAELARTRRHVEHLEIALQTNRHIGIAIGIIMARRGLTQDQAFAILRDASQRTHRRIRDLADEIVYTGELPAVDAG